MQKLREMFPARDPRVVSIGHLAPGWSGGRTAGIDPFLPFKIDLMTGRKRHEETLPDFVHLAARATPRGSDYSRRTGSASPIDVTIRRPRERPFGAPLGGKAITFPTPLVIRTVYNASFPMRFPIGFIGKHRLGHCHIRENYLPRHLIA